MLAEAIEFRCENRVQVDFFVNEVVSDHDKFLCRAVNLSHSGIHLVTLPRQTKAFKFSWLSFWLPNSDELVRVLAEVRYQTREKGMLRTGYKFKYVNPRYRKLLESYLQGRSTEEISAVRFNEVYRPYTFRR